MRQFFIRLPNRKIEKIQLDTNCDLTNKLVMKFLSEWKNHCNENWIKFGKKDLIMQDSEDLVKTFLETCGTFLLNSMNKDYWQRKKISKNEISSYDAVAFQQMYKPQEVVYKQSGLFQTDLSRILELEKQEYKIKWCIVDRYGKFSFRENNFFIYGNKEYSRQEIKIKKEMHDFFSMDKILVAYKESVILEEINIGKYIVKKPMRVPDKNSFRFFDQNIKEITSNILE